MNDQVPEVSREELLRRYGKKSPEAPTDATRRSPFKFLDSYDIDDADIFFGRDSEIVELLQHFQSYGHVLIYGESGSGKSSLVQCGLRSRIPEADSLFIPLRVHTVGLPTVCYQICESASQQLGAVVDCSIDVGLVETLRAAREAASRPIVLFFDQFEELFIFHDSKIRRHFAEELASIRTARLKVKLILGVRQDYLAHLSELEGTVQGLFDNRFWLRRMSRENAAQAVVKACGTCDVEIAADLANSIIHRLDPSGQGVELPYLQVVMDRLHRQAVDENSLQPMITAQAVERLGDITNILGTFLVDEVAKLPAPDIGRQMLKAFVTRAGTCCNLDREAVAQAAAGFGKEIPTDVLDAHLDQMVRVRLLRETADDGSYELRHDALAATVLSWVSEVEKELLEVRDNLINRYKEYVARGQDDTALLDGDFMSYLAVYEQRLSPLLDDSIHRYIGESRKRLSARKRRKRLIIGASLFSIALLGLAGLFMYVASVTTARDAALMAEANAARQATRAGEAAERANAEAKKAKEELLRSQRLLYMNDIVSAQHDWNANESAGAWRHLDACPPELQGWEHGYLQTLFTRNHKTLRGHSGYVRAVDVSPDGSRIVSGSYDHNLIVWDTDSAKQLWTLIGHEGVVTSVAYSPDGNRIASASRDNTLKVWNPETREAVRTFEGHSDFVDAVAFSPDGTHIVSGGDDNLVKLWNVATGVEIMNLEGHTDRVNSVAFNPDGNRIVSGSDDKKLIVWDAATGERRLTLSGHDGRVYAVAFILDGSTIVSGSRDQTVKVWDATSGNLKSTKEGHNSAVYSIGFKRIGRQIVSGSRDNTLKLWDVDTDEVVSTLQGHTSTVYGVACFPDDNRIVSASRDKTLKLWDGTSGEEALTLRGHTSSVPCVTFSGDGSQVVSGSWDKMLKLWNVDTGEEAMSLEGHRAPVAAVAFSPDDSRIISGSEDQSLILWDASTGERIFSLEGHDGAVTSVAFSPDGNHIVSGSLDKTVRLWNAGTGKETMTHKGHKAAVYAVAFSPDGSRIVSGGGRKEEVVELMVWDAVTGRQTRTLEGHTGLVTAVAFNRDGSRIVSASNDQTIRLWNAATRVEIRNFKGHNDIVTSIAFSPDESRIVSGSLDNTLKLWDTNTGDEMLTLKGHTSGIAAVDFARDGSRIVSGSSDKTVKIWGGGRRQEQR